MNITNNQTSITGTDSVEVTVANHAKLKGSAIANKKADGSDGGNLVFAAASLSQIN